MSERFILNNEIPADIADAVRKEMGDLSDIKIALEGDMRADGTFGSQWFVFTEQNLAIFTSADGTAECRQLHNTSDIHKIEIISGTSNAVIELTDSNGLQRILRISNIKRKEFSDAVSLITAFIKDGEWKPETIDSKQKTCEKCGKPLPENMNICPRCLDKKKILKRVFTFLRPHRTLVERLFLLMVLTTVLGLIQPFLVKILVDDVLKPLRNRHYLLPLCSLMFVSYLLLNLTDIFKWKTSTKIGTSTIYEIRAALFNKLQELSLSFYAKHNAGSIITRVNQDTQQLQALLVDFIPYGISSLFMAVGIISILFYFSWYLTLFILIPVVTMAVLVWKIFPRFKIFWERFFEKRSKLASYVENVINGMRVVKAFAQEGSERERFDTKNSEFKNAAYDAEMKWAYTMPLLHFLAIIGVPIVWYIGGGLAFEKEMTLGEILAFIGYVGMLFQPVFIITRLAQIIPNTLAAAGRVFDVIDEIPEISDSENAVGMPCMEGEIEFRDVTFSYEPNKPVLHNLSTVIKPGTMVGLVGHSGAGKSTTINLICRLFEVHSGKILIDGVDIRDIRYEDLRRQIGIVMQETFLLNGTIAQNIAYARPEATEVEIIQAAKAANAHDFIMNKPDGYDTEVQQGGKNLSTGEKQRISIARAILINPRILILDEATASVDLETEKQIQEAIEKMTRDRTTIAIAHRLSTLRNADRLIVLDKGKLVEDGTHEELEQKEDGVYAKLIKLHQDTAGVKGID